MPKNTDTKKEPKKRIDFERGVPEVLFRMAGGHCSVPRCKKPAMGPFQDGLNAVNMGTACHIYSAAENGPRGRGGKGEKFIAGAENGLWCCSYHGNLIDKGKGKDYTAPTLFAWKALAEARVRKQMNDIPSPLGWVESIEFTEFGERPRLPRMTLSRNTLLAGGNGAGKSALLEAAASISNSSFGVRFQDTFARMPDGSLQPIKFAAEILYSTVDYANKKVTVDIRGDNLTRTEGRTPCLLPPGDVEVILVSDLNLMKRADEDDVDYFMRILSVDRTAFFALAKLGTKSVMPAEIGVREAEWHDEDGNIHPVLKNSGVPYLELTIKRVREHLGTFNTLSGSERTRFIIDMFMSKAREVCKQRLTLLLIDDFVANLDNGNYVNLMKKLSQEDFQSVVVLPSAREANVATKVDGVSELKELDYLGQWSLFVVDAYPMRR